MAECIIRAQRLFGESLVQIFVDDCRFEQNIAIVNQGRYHGIGIDLQIFGLELIAGMKIDHMALEGQSFFGKNDAYTKTDLRLTYRSANGKLTLQAFVNNVE